MLIYNSNNTPFASTANYKSGNKIKRSSIPKKTAKRTTRPRNKRKNTNKTLNAKNVKLLKNLGFRVRKK